MTLLEKIRDDYEKALENHWTRSGEKAINPLKVNTGQPFSSADIERVQAAIRDTYRHPGSTVEGFANTK